LPVFKTIPPAARLALTYLGFSVLWILLSDELVAQIANHNSNTIQKLQTAKGITFVLSSALLLFLVARKIYKSLEDTLAKKEELLNKFNALSRASREGVVDYSIETDVAVVNEEMKLLLGAESTVISNFAALHNKHIHPDDLHRVSEYFKEFLQSNDRVWQWEYRYATAEGSYKDIISRGFVIRDQETKRPLHVIYTLQDVTELRDTKTRYYQQQMYFKQSLSRTMIEAQENERNRWAQELHDNVCQILTVAKLYSDQALLNTNESPFVVKSKEMIEKAINDIRHISANIKSPEFDITSLFESINSLVETIKRFVSFSFEINYDPQADTVLSKEQKLMVYRVIQEQLNNIMKYSGATNIWVNVAVNKEQLEVSIKDDGRGFDPVKVKAGIGLKNINSRLQVFSGSMNIDSAPGKGCELKAHFNIQ